MSQPFRAAVAAVRAGLRGREPDRTLFDLLVAAGWLTYRIPDDRGNLRDVTGRADPRRRLAREFGLGATDRTRRARAGWAAAGRRLTRVLTRELAAKGDEEYRPLRVLLGYAPASLAPEGVVPTDPTLRAAWKTAVGVPARLFTTTVRPLGRLACLRGGMLARLRDEAAPGLRKGRGSSGRRPGPDGRNLAVDRKLMAIVGRAVGKDLVPAYSAKYLYYTAPGDHIWPHSDDPRYPVTCLICVDRRTPRGAPRSAAFQAFRPDGSMERYEMAPGQALAFDAGLVHAREPMRRGERVVLLSILYCVR